MNCESKANQNPCDNNLCKKVETISINSGICKIEHHCLIRETRLRIEINGKHHTELICIRKEIEYLTAGYLLTEGLIEKWEDIRTLEITGEPPCAKVVISNAKPGSYALVELSDLKIPIDALRSLWDQINSMDNLYLSTRGVHSTALCSTDSVLFYTSDIARLNTLDKIAGKCIQENIDVSDKFLICSGRFTSKMLAKIRAMGISLAISRAVATVQAVSFAQDIGITLASGTDKIVIYTHPERIICCR